MSPFPALVSGLLRHRVTVEAPTSAPDPDGGWLEDWAPLTPPDWACSIVAASQRDLETITSGTVLSQATHILRGHFHPGLTTKSRVQFDVMGDYAGQVLRDGAVAYWRLGDKSGTTAVDAIGCAPGTISGGVTLGQAGALSDGDKAMQFDGATGQIDIPVGSYGAIGTGPCSIEAWIRRSTYPPDQNAIVCNGRLYIDAGINLRVQDDYASFDIGNGTTALLNYAQALPRDTAWHHIAGVVVRGTTDETQLFIDGVLRSTLPVPAAGWNLTSSNPLRVAHSGVPATEVRYAGTIDEIAIYQTALTPAQIANHYALSQPVPRMFNVIDVQNIEERGIETRLLCAEVVE